MATAGRKGGDDDVTDYLNMDVSALTVDDARHDTEWGKQPHDFFRYVTIDTAVLTTFDDFTDEEIVQTIKAIRAYCLEGELPDYRTMKSTAVKVAVRSVIAAHEERMTGEYLKKYKQYAGAKQRQARIREEEKRNQ